MKESTNNATPSAGKYIKTEESMKKRYLTKSLTVALAIATAASTFSGTAFAAAPLWSKDTDRRYR